MTKKGPKNQRFVRKLFENKRRNIISTKHLMPKQSHLRYTNLNQKLGKQIIKKNIMTEISNNSYFFFVFNDSVTKNYYHNCKAGSQ